MGKFWSAVFLVVLCSCSSTYAKTESPDVLRQEAFVDITTASSLMQKAANAMSNANNENDLRLSIQLFAEAGKLFQSAGSKLEVLVPEYASQEDLEGCKQAMTSCLNAINNIKKRLTQI
ncbi:MAG: hypothetical protein PHQ52_06065 [Candidatus Omnitrophica bacterium]|nr:hypothetical protein [Candidatus Omnitrophota bacterium]